MPRGTIAIPDGWITLWELAGRERSRYTVVRDRALAGHYGKLLTPIGKKRPLIVEIAELQRRNVPIPAKAPTFNLGKASREEIAAALDALIDGIKHRPGGGLKAWRARSQPVVDAFHASARGDAAPLVKLLSKLEVKP
jgi:hypothetical protein